MKSLHVDWFSIRHQFSSISASDSAAMMVSPTRIIFVFHLLRKNTSWTLSMMGSICKTFCDEVWKNMNSWYGQSSHYLVGVSIMRLHDVSSTFANVFVILLQQWVCSRIFLASSSWILMHSLWYFSVWIIHCFLHSDFFIHNHCRWCDQGFFWGFVYPLLFHIHHPQFSHDVKT